MKIKDWKIFIFFSVLFICSVFFHCFDLELGTNRVGIPKVWAQYEGFSSYLWENQQILASGQQSVPYAYRYHEYLTPYPTVTGSDVMYMGRIIPVTQRESNPVTLNLYYQDLTSLYRISDIPSETWSRPDNLRGFTFPNSLRPISLPSIIPQYPLFNYTDYDPSSKTHVYLHDGEIMKVTPLMRSFAWMYDVKMLFDPSYILIGIEDYK